MKQDEIIELIQKWKDEIKDLAVNYATAIGKLDAARKRYDYPLLRIFLNPLVLIILLLLVLPYFLTQVPCGSYWEGMNIKFTTSPCSCMSVK